MCKEENPHFFSILYYFRIYWFLFVYLSIVYILLLLTILHTSLYFSISPYPSPSNTLSLPLSFSLSLYPSHFLSPYPSLSIALWLYRSLSLFNLSLFLPAISRPFRRPVVSRRTGTITILPRRIARVTGAVCSLIPKRKPPSPTCWAIGYRGVCRRGVGPLHPLPLLCHLSPLLFR